MTKKDKRSRLIPMQKCPERSSKCFCVICGKYPWEFDGYYEHQFHDLLKKARSKKELYFLLRNQFLPTYPCAKKTWALAGDLVKYGAFSISQFCRVLLIDSKPMLVHDTICRDMPTQKYGTITFRRFKGL